MFRRTPNYNKLDTFNKRKYLDFQALKELCERTKKINYKVLKYNRKSVPDEYEITYENVRSVIGIKKNKAPIYGYNHKLHIKLGPKYPEPPAICYFMTPIWHPNIKFAGVSKGRVCYNSKELPSDYKLDELIEFIGKMIQYKNYHAILGKEPYPEDVEAAKWVMEYAEPMGLVNYLDNKAIDNSYLLDPIDDDEHPKQSDIEFL